MKKFTEFFGFYQDPFKRTPDVDFYYPTNMHLEALDTLSYLIHSDEPFAVLTGEPGTGKTITIKKFLNELPKNIVSAYILFPNLTPEELFMAILEDFNIPVDKTLTKNTLFAKLRDFLVEIGSQGKKAVIIIDEAQNLPNETLEELRLLSNLETEKDKLLKIILAGQPELDDKLNEESLRQLKQRVTLYVKLSNIKQEDIKSYIYSHLEKAGKGDIKIQSGVVRKIAKVTKGNPRLINTLMERTIIAAFLDSSHTITEEHLASAVSSINHVIPTYKRKSVLRKKPVTLIAIIAVLAVITGYLGVDKIMQSLEKPITYVHTQIDNAKKQNQVVEVAENNMDNKQQEIENNNQQQEVIVEEYKEIVANNQPLENTMVANNNINTNVTNENINTTTNTTPNVVAVETHGRNESNNISSMAVSPVPNNSIIPYEPKQEEVTEEIAEVKEEVIVAEPKPKDVFILVDSLNVRATPNLGAGRITALKTGQKFEYVQENDEWVEIRLSPTKTGWVYKQYVSITERQ